MMSSSQLKSIFTPETVLRYTLIHKTLQDVDAAPRYLSFLLDTRSIFIPQVSLLCMFLGQSKHLHAGDLSFTVTVPKLWNSVPTGLAKIASTTTFPKHLKTHLFKLIVLFLACFYITFLVVTCCIVQSYVFLGEDTLLSFSVIIFIKDDYRLHKKIELFILY